MSLSGLQDLVGLLAMATATGYLGRVLGRLEDQDRCLQFVAALVFFLAFYTVLFELIKEYNVTLTASGIKCPYTISISVLMLTTTGMCRACVHLNKKL